MPEGVRRCRARLLAGPPLPGPVADEDALLVRDAAAGRGDPGDRGVRQAGGPGGRQAAARLVRPQQDVGQRGPRLLAGEPAEQDGGHLLTPRHLHRGARVDHHDGVRVGGGHPRDQFVLAPRQGQARTVEALRLGLLGGRHDHDHGVRSGGGPYGLLDPGVRVELRLRVAEREGQYGQIGAESGAARDEPQRHVQGLPGRQLRRHAVLRRVHERLERVVRVRGAGGVEQHPAADGQP